MTPMTERPAVFVLGDDVQAWAESWRGPGPADVEAAVARGIELCDTVIGRAGPLLAKAAVRPPSPKHLLLLRAMLGTWTTGVWRYRKRLAPADVPPAVADADRRALAMIRSLYDAERAATAARSQATSQG